MKPDYVQGYARGATVGARTGGHGSGAQRPAGGQRKGAMMADGSHGWRQGREEVGERGGLGLEIGSNSGETLHGSPTLEDGEAKFFQKMHRKSDLCMYGKLLHGSQVIIHGFGPLVI